MQGARHRFQLNFRNHRKNVVIDGREAWIGGHNVGDEYLGLDPQIGHWRDTHVRVTGPAALLAQASFLADWYWAKRTLPTLSWEPQAAPDGSNVMALVGPLSPVDDLEPAQLFFVHALNAARERIWIANAYFVPDAAVMAALRLAALRGVDVRIIFPKKSDNPVVDLATLWFAAELAGLGIRFYRHTSGFMHQKVFLADRDVSSVGSTNFDNRSFRLQFELNVLIVDEHFAREVENMLLRDLERSEPYEPSVLRQASFPTRFAASLARLTAPLL
jgi:cardiolipin synthase